MIVFKEHMMKHNALRLNIPLQLFISTYWAYYGRLDNRSVVFYINDILYIILFLIATYHDSGQNLVNFSNEWYTARKECYKWALQMSVTPQGKGVTTPKYHPSVSCLPYRFSFSGPKNASSRFKNNMWLPVPDLCKILAFFSPKSGWIGGGGCRIIILYNKLNVWVKLCF